MRVVSKCNAATGQKTRAVPDQKHFSGYHIHIHETRTISRVVSWELMGHTLTVMYIQRWAYRDPLNSVLGYVYSTGSYFTTPHKSPWHTIDSVDRCWVQPQPVWKLERWIWRSRCLCSFRTGSWQSRKFDIRLSRSVILVCEILYIKKGVCTPEKNKALSWFSNKVFSTP